MTTLPPHRPLYLQVRDTLLARIGAGDPPPGGSLPSETALAAGLGVSVGTLRKAIDGLVDDGTLIRHQGRGTYVAEQTAERAAYRFLRLVDGSGTRLIPEPGPGDVADRPATTEEAAALDLASGAAVSVLSRVRSVGGVPALAETVVVPAALFPRLAAEDPLPNALYPFYQARHGVTVRSVDDRLSAIAATAAEAAPFSLPEGSPMLQAIRVARDLAGRPVEWRRTLFARPDHAYAVTLS